MRRIRVISGEKDGADLRREERKDRYSLRCDGKRDEQEISEALQSSGKNPCFGIGAEAWNKIFGGKP